MIDNEKTAQDILEISRDNLSQPEELQEQSAEQSVQMQQVQEETPQARNFRQLRESKERAERERDEAYRILREVELRKQQAQPQQEEENLDFSIAPDELAEGKHLSKVDKKIKKLEQQIQAYQRRSYEDITEARIKSQYPDFDKVVSQDNVSALRSTYPELAETLNSATDLYTKAISAYTLIKKLGIQPDRSYDMDKEIALRNAAKPRPLTSVSPQQGESPLTKANAFANGLTEDLKTQLLKEMREVRRNN